MTAAVLLLALGCAVPRLEERPSSETAVFPHDADYDLGAAHGSDSLRIGTEICGSCHQLEGEPDGPLGSPPACAECHDSYPHEPGWRAGAVHGVGLSGEDADRTACLACHEGEGLQAATDHGCTSCHGSYPHEADWAQAGQHGLYGLASPDPAVVCGSCHGSALQGSDTAPACAECHDSWPHETGWADPAAHGPVASADLSGCSGCHATEGSWDGGPVGVACARCHASYPHTDDWGADHLPAALLAGETICLRCHEAGDGPSTMVALCARSCHGGAE